MLTVEGQVASPRSFDLKGLQGLPSQIEDVSALVPGRQGGAVWLRDALAAAGVLPAARFATLAAADGGFAISVPLLPLLERALLLYRKGDSPLPADKGGPVRVLFTGDVACHADEIDACAMVKGLGRIRLTEQQEADVGHRPHS